MAKEHLPKLSVCQNCEAPADSAGITAADPEATVPTENDAGDDTIRATLFGEEIELEKADLVTTGFSLAPKGMFVLLPIFAALLALMYRRSRRLYVEHLIFSLHYHTLVFVVLLAALLVPWDWFTGVVWIGFHVYLYLAMKRVYSQGWLKTWAKHALLIASYGVVMTVFVVMIVFGSVVLTAQAAKHPGWLGWLV